MSIIVELFIVTEPETVKPRKNCILRLEAELPLVNVIDAHEPVAFIMHVFPVGIIILSVEPGTPFGFQFAPLFQLLFWTAVKVLVCEKILHDINKIGMNILKKLILLLSIRKGFIFLPNSYR